MIPFNYRFPRFPRFGAYNLFRQGGRLVWRFSQMVWSLCGLGSSAVHSLLTAAAENMGRKSGLFRVSESDPVVSDLQPLKLCCVPGTSLIVGGDMVQDPSPSRPLNSPFLTPMPYQTGPITNSLRGCVPKVWMSVSVASKHRRRRGRRR